MATCHHTHTTCMVPHVGGKKRASSLDDDYMLEKRPRLCNGLATLDLGVELAHIMHVTRRRSHELTKLLCLTPQRDRRSIRHQLDPSIFDAEVSEDEENEENAVSGLLPEVREELRCLLKPCCLDAGYDEQAELLDKSSNSSSDELPDLDEDDLERTKEDVKEQKQDVFRRSSISRTNSSEIVPVLDRLKLQPVVRLTRLEDCSVQINKKLKLKNGSFCSASLAENKFVWNQEHNSRLRSIVSSVGRHLSAAKTRCVQRTASSSPGQEQSIGIRKPLKIQMNDEDEEDGCEEQVFVKRWRWGSESSDSDMETTDSEQHNISDRASKVHHKRSFASRPRAQHPVHATLALCNRGKMVSQLSRCLVNMLEGCDTEDTDFQLRFLRLCHSCLAEWLTWPPVLLRQLFRLIIDGDCASVQWGAYDVLSTLLAFNAPAQLPFNWPAVCDITKRLQSGGAAGAAGGRAAHSSLGPGLALRYVVSALEQDFLHSPRRSRISRWFTGGHRHQCIAQITSWLLSSVRAERRPVVATLGQPDDICRDTALTSAQVPRLLPLYQRLLDLFVTTCGTADVHMEKIITELSQGYIRLPNYAHRYLLVSTVKSAVVVFKLCQRILKDYSHGVRTCSSTNSRHTVSSLLNDYGMSVPLKQHFPKDNEGSSKAEDKEVTAKDDCSSAAVEEIAFLTWSMVSAHVRMNKGEQDAPAEISPRIQRIEAWYRSLATQLSPKTQLYLRMMESLSPTPSS